MEEKCENGLMIADYCGKVKDDYSQNKEANPLLVQRNSDFASQNKEDYYVSTNESNFGCSR